MARFARAPVRPCFGSTSKEIALRSQSGWPPAVSLAGGAEFFPGPSSYSLSSSKVLRHVGTEAIEVTIPSCGGFNQPQKRHWIRARFSTLIVAEEGDGETITAVWSEVELGKRRPRPIDDRDCELLEHFQKHLLSEIEHEVIGGMAVCGASRQSIKGRLRLKVLKPVTEGDGTKNPESG